MIRYIFGVFFFLFCRNCWSNTDSLVLKKFNYFLNFGMHSGMVWAHSEKINFVAESKVLGIDFEILKKRNDTLDRQYNTKGFLTGFGANYFYIDNSILKSNANLYLTIESNFFQRKKMNMALKVCAGLNFVSNPYDSINNAINWVYSSYVNAYLAAGLLLNYEVNNQYHFGLKFMFNHFSNGGLKFPNYGLNYMTGALVLRKNLNTTHEKWAKISKRLSNEDKKVNVKLSLFATYQPSTLSFEKYFLVNGTSVSLNKPFGKNKIHSLAFTTDWIIDRANAEHLKDEKNKGKSHHRVGVSVGHEFLFHQFTWGQFFGYYLFNEISFISNFYHRHSLDYSLSKKWRIGISLLASEQKANFTDLRLTYKLK